MAGVAAECRPCVNNFASASSTTTGWLQPSRCKRARPPIASAGASVVDVGRDLLEVKEHLEHGQFKAWVERECGLRLRTAERLMQAVAVLGKSVNLTYLPPDGLLALAARTAPRPAVDAIVDRNDAGERPTAADIKRALAVAKGQLRASQPEPNGTCRELAGDPASAPRDQEGVSERSPEQQLDALMHDWEGAGGEARSRFLKCIGAQMVTGEIPVPSQSRTATGAIEGATEEPSLVLPVSAELRAVDTTAETWVGRNPPPEIFCAARSGKCGYGTCAQQRRCLQVRPLAAA